jgi:histone acetyltransferase (RNA polymerase elongator complex component)
VTDPRTTRIADLCERMTALEPPAVRVARVRYDIARRDLAGLVRRGGPARIVQAYRYRADRAHDALVNAWRDATG